MRNTRNIEMSFYKAQKVAAFIMARKVEGDPEYDGSIFKPLLMGRRRAAAECTRV